MKLRIDKKILLIIFVYNFLQFNLCFSNEPIRPTKWTQLLTKDSREDDFVFLPHAKLVWADYDALRRDFPRLRLLSDPLIDAWILRNFSFISKTQLSLNGIRNTDFNVDSTIEKKGIRPPLSNRAAFLTGDLDSTSEIVNIKGNGNWMSTLTQMQIDAFRSAMGNQAIIDEIRSSPYRDGLASMGEIIAEVTRQKAAQMLMDLCNYFYGTHYETVESYFIIDTGVDLLKPGQQKIPAALYGRQASIGRFENSPVLEGILTGPDVSLQKTLGAYIDFGAVRILDTRLNHLFKPLFGSSEDQIQSSSPWVWGHEVAIAYRKGDLKAVTRHIQEMINPITEDWNRLEIAKFRKNFSNPSANNQALTASKDFVSTLEDVYKQGSERDRKNILDYFESHEQEISFSIIQDLFRGSFMDKLQVGRLLAFVEESPEKINLVELFLNSESPHLNYVGIMALANCKSQRAFELVLAAVNNSNNQVSMGAQQLSLKMIEKTQVSSYSCSVNFK